MRADGGIWRGTLVVLLMLGGLTACKQKGPGHAFDPMLQRLPPSAHAWLMLDAQAAAEHYASAWKTLRALPVCQAQPELGKRIDDLRAIADGGLVLARKNLGFDPLSDIQRIAGAVIFEQDAKPRMALVVQGRFPADVPKRMFPEAQEEKQGEQRTYVTPGGGPDLALLGTETLLLADKGLLKGMLSAKALPEAVFKQHPSLKQKLAPDFVFRLSVGAPLWLSKALQAVRTQPGVSALMGFDHLELEWDSLLRLAIAGKDEKAANNAEDILGALTELNQAGIWAIRSAVQLALAAELEGMEDMPGWLKEAIRDPKPWLASLEALAPAPKVAPKINRQGTRVSMEMPVEGLQALLVWALPVVLPTWLSGGGLSVSSVTAGGTP